MPPPGVPQLSTDAASDSRGGWPRENNRTSIDPAGGTPLVGQRASRRRRSGGTDRRRWHGPRRARRADSRRPQERAAALHAGGEPGGAAGRSCAVPRALALAAERCHRASRRAAGDRATMPRARCSRAGAAMPRPAMPPTAWSGCFAPKWRRACFSCSSRRRASERRDFRLRDSRPPSKVRCGACCSSVPRICWRRIMPTGTRLLLEALLASETLPPPVPQPRRLHLGRRERRSGRGIRSRRRCRCCPRSSTCRRCRWPAATTTCRAFRGRITGRPSASASPRDMRSEGYFHMPGGQSGHPLSPFYRAGFAAWAEGRPTPFLPGPPTRIAADARRLDARPRCGRA